MSSLQTREQLVDRLRSGCEQCISNLKELILVQFEMDPPDREIRQDDEEIVYRLRKVLLHIKAITSWQLDTEIMHVLAPEFRTADEQIDMIRKKLPKEQLIDYLGDDGKSVVGGRDQLSKLEKENLSSYIHPTPQRLILGKESGGLGRPEEVRYFVTLFTLLVSLVFRYGITLGFLSQTLGVRKEGAIASVLMMSTKELDSIPIADCLRFVAKAEPGTRFQPQKYCTD